MPRQKKDSVPICYRIERSVYERLQAYAEDKGQTMTMAVERLLTKALDAEEKKEDNLKRIWCPNRMPDFFRTFCLLGGNPTQKLEEVAHPKSGLKTEIPQKSWKESLSRNKA